MPPLGTFHFLSVELVDHGQLTGRRVEARGCACLLFPHDPPPHPVASRPIPSCLIPWRCVVLCPAQDGGFSYASDGGSIRGGRGEIEAGGGRRKREMRDTHTEGGREGERREGQAGRERRESRKREGEGEGLLCGCVGIQGVFGLFPSCRVCCVSGPRSCAELTRASSSSMHYP